MNTFPRTALRRAAALLLLVLFLPWANAQDRPWVFICEGRYELLARIFSGSLPGGLAYQATTAEVAALFPANGAYSPPGRNASASRAYDWSDARPTVRFVMTMDGLQRLESTTFRAFLAMEDTWYLLDPLMDPAHVRGYDHWDAGLPINTLSHWQRVVALAPRSERRYRFGPAPMWDPDHLDDSFFSRPHLSPLRLRTYPGEPLGIGARGIAFGPSGHISRLQRYRRDVAARYDAQVMGALPELGLDRNWVPARLADFPSHEVVAMLLPRSADDLMFRPPYGHVEPAAAAAAVPGASASAATGAGPASTGTAAAPTAQAAATNTSVNATGFGAGPSHGCCCIS